MIWFVGCSFFFVISRLPFLLDYAGGRDQPGLFFRDDVQLKLHNIVLIQQFVDVPSVYLCYAPIGNSVVTTLLFSTTFPTLFTRDVGPFSLFCLKLAALASAEDFCLQPWRLLPR